MLLCEVVIEADFLEKVQKEFSDPKQSVDVPSVRTLHEWLDLVREHPATIHESGLQEAIERAIPGQRQSVPTIDFLRQVLLARRASIAYSHAQKDMLRTILNQWIAVLRAPRQRAPEAP